MPVAAPRSIPPLSAGVAVCAAVTAAWPIVSLQTRDEAGWMALPVGVAAALAVRALHLARPSLRAAVAAAIVALASAYARWTQYAALHAGLLGLSWIDAAATLDPAFVWALARARTSATEWLLQAFGLALAVGGAALRLPPRQRD